MIDFIKTGTKLNDVKSFLGKLRSKDVRYDGIFNGETYEVTGEYSAKIKSISIRVHPSNWVIISGSIHEYWNNGKHNYNDFTLQDFVKSVEELNETIGIDLWSLRLFQIELGVNIPTPIPVPEILHNSFMHKKVEFRWASITGEGTYYHCKHKEYYIKLYDKATQHGLPSELLRYEIKFKSEFLRKQGITNFADVLLKKNIDFMKKFLLDEYTNILFYDQTFIMQNISTQQKAQISNWSNPRFWNGLSKRSSSKNIFANSVNSMRAFQAKYTRNIQAQVHELIKSKLGELDNISNSGIKLPNGRNGRDFDETLQYESKEQNGSFGSSIIDPHKPEGPHCVVTKLSTSIQSVDVLYLTAEGITYIFENYPKIFTRLIELYAPKFLLESKEKKIKELEKSIYRKYQSIHRKSTKAESPDMMKLFYNSKLQFNS